MSEEELKELQEYNLEYLEAQASEEMFGGDFTSAVELKQAKKEIERLNKQLQLISDEFLKYDWENSSKKQIINQLKSLYNSIFKGSDKE